jgi:hypothetical protein
MRVDERKMQADPQLRQPVRPRYCVGGGRAADHQACRRKDPEPVSLLDGFVYGRVEPEIVCTDDQVSQLAISRPRRN